ncbi:MAG: hypothetical protein PHW76_03770 [Alphaproteobacteria bacterium]|nr:hypothetical protein [Alphaproteobacteria bacterium]
MVRKIEFCTSPAAMRALFRRKITKGEVQSGGLVIITAGTNSLEKSLLIKDLYPNAVQERGPEFDNQEKILEAIFLHGKGCSLEQVYISSHGAPNLLHPDASVATSGVTVYIKEFLGAVYEAQKSKNGGRPYANRFVFAGCNTLANLTPKDVEDYISLARVLKAEIVGTTSMHCGTSARFIKFNPDGTIGRDWLDSKLDPFVWKGMVQTYMRGYSTRWVSEVMDQQHKAACMAYLCGPRP